MWAIKCTTPILPIHGSRERLNVIGAIDPINDQGFFAYIDNLNAKNFEGFLRGITARFPGSGKLFLILDNSRAHHANSLNPFLSSVQNKLELVFLPPYSPDLSEIEELWRKIKREVVYNTFYESFEEFKEALTSALRRARDSNGKIKNLCNFEKHIKVEG